MDASGVDAYDRLGVGFAQVDPFVGKVDFHAVDVGDLLACEFLFYGFEDGVDVDVGCKLDFVFGDGVGG